MKLIPSPIVWALALILTPSIHAAVLAIDYGAEFTKLSLVKPGVPFDVVLDRDSKRKISSVVGWKREDRVFGAEGKMAATRFPDTHYPYIKPLLANSNAPSLSIYPSSPLQINNTLYFPHPKAPSHAELPSRSDTSGVWSPTALLAHQIAYYRSLAESLASTGGVKETIKDVIVTVPSWWTQQQRRAYRDALELQGLVCLSMVGEGTAVGLNFAMTRNFPLYNPETGEGEKEYHAIYDSGALSTTATVLAFYHTSVLPSPKSKTPINTTHVDVLGVGWSEVGGVHFDVAVQEILRKDFQQKSGHDIAGDKRAMAKLVKEANRVKHILSANQESNVAIESLYDDIDYKSRLSRVDFESAISTHESSFASPLPSALSAAGINLDQLSSVLLFGGNTRVPLVQAALKSSLGEREDIIAQNVNADEAAVLGAAYYGAALSRQFKMKNIQLHERTVFDYTVGTGEVLFPRGTELGSRKALELQPVDQSVEVSQNGRPLFAINLHNVSQSLANFTTPEPFLNLTFRLDHRGHLAAVNAVIVSNQTLPDEEASEGGMAGALKGLFGGKKDKDKAEAETEGEATVDGEENVKESKSKIKEREKKRAAAEAKEAAKEAKREKVVVPFRESALGARPMTAEEKKVAKNVLRNIATYELKRHNREEARNHLEGYLYRLQGLLSPDSDNKAMEDFARPHEREALTLAVSSAFEWLSENAEGADESVLRAKRVEIEEVEKPIIHRFKESLTRPGAVDDFQQAMFAARQFWIDGTKNVTREKRAVENATAQGLPLPAPPRYSDEELASTKELIMEYETWMNEIMEKQVPLEEDKTNDPVVLTKDLDERGKYLQRTILALQNRKLPKAPRVKASASSSTTSTSSSTESTTTSTASASTSEAASAEESGSGAPPRHEEL